MSDEVDNRPPPPRLEDVPAERLISVGGPVHEFNITLRIFGADLDPDDVSSALQAKPTIARRKGDRLPGRYRRSAKEGAWMIEREFDGSTNIELDQAINRLLDELNPDPAVWENLNRRFKCDLFCGLFLGEGGGNEGFSLAPKTLRRLAERGLEVDFDLYYGL